jgi:tetratricopeptide (TPR) repeat protein
MRVVAKNDLAMADLDEAIKRDPKKSPRLGQRGNLFLAAGQFERALANYNHAIGDRANNPFALGHRATPI